MYRLGTVSIKLLGGLNRFYGYPTSPSTEAEKLRFEGKLENFKTFYGMRSMMDVFDFLLNDRNSDVYRSESKQHKHLLSKAAHAKFIREKKKLFKLVEDIRSH